MLKRASYLMTVVLVVSFCVSPLMWASSRVQAKGSKEGLSSAPTVSLQNSYIEALSSAGGRFVIGTTGGDPNSGLDDNKQLLYGYPNDIGTTFSTLRIVDGSSTSDYRLGAVDYNNTGISPLAPPASDGSAIVTIYVQDNVRVQERLYFTQNPETGTDSATAIEYTLTNLAGQSRAVGLRLLLDIMVGSNDGAPYFIDGQGYVTHQSEWLSGDVPSYWVSYESPVFSTDSLKGRGQLTGGDTTPPDRFVIADWAQASDTTWAYTVKPLALITKDSATILYYNPTTLGAGQSRVIRTYYGIAGAGGVSLPQLTGLEVTQGIQDLNASVSLIQDRPTYLRAHVHSTLGVIPGVSAQLSGTRGGAPLPGSPLAPLNAGGAIDLLENPDRRQLGQSFLFSLPAQWLTGTVTLEVSGVDRTIGCRDQVGVPNDCKVEVTFQPAPAPEVRFVGFTWEQAGVVHEPTPLHVAAVERQILTTFPLAGLTSSYGGNIDARFLGGPPSSQLDFVTLNNLLDTTRLLDGCVSSGTEGCKRYYVGVVTDKPGGTTYNGLALASPSFVATAYQDNQLSGAQVFASALGQPYTLCRGDEPSPATDYPYADALISGDTSGDGAFYGFDINTTAVYPPYTRDLMSYCLPRWPSDWTYTHLQGALASVLGASAGANRQPAVQTAGPAILVSGILTFTNDSGQFSSAYVLPASSPVVPAPGAYTIQLENSSGQALASYPFVPRVASAGSSNGSFALLLPWDAATTRIVLLHGAKLLDTRQTSAHAPTVQLLYPVGGETLSGPTATVRWSAADQDGNSLTYIVQYSKDAGASWQTLASGWRSMTYALDLATLPGSDQALMRVLASDGVYTAQDQSHSTFTVARHPPSAYIVAPANNSLFVGNQAIALNGNGTSVEDGPLGDAALTWSSNRNGVLGTGSSLVVSAASLQEGVHVITLTAGDSHGQTNAVTTNIQVSRTPLPLPPRLSVAPGDMQFTALAYMGPTPWQQLSIENSGDGDLAWSLSGAPSWLRVSADNGYAPAGVLLSASPEGLKPGAYTGTVTVTVTSAGADNSPQAVTVRLSVLPGNQVFLPVILNSK